MKKVLLTLILTLLSATLLWAQAPQGFTYQAVVRNADGTAVSNRTVSVKLSFKALQVALKAMPNCTTPPPMRAAYSP